MTLSLEWKEMTLRHFAERVNTVKQLMLSIQLPALSQTKLFPKLAENQSQIPEMSWTNIISFRFNFQEDIFCCGARTDLVHFLYVLKVLQGHVGH